MKEVEALAIDETLKQEGLETPSVDIATEMGKQQEEAQRLVAEVQSDMARTENALQELKGDSWMVEAGITNADEYKMKAEELTGKLQQLASELSQLQGEMKNADSDAISVEQEPIAEGDVEGYTRQFVEQLESGALSATDIAEQIGQDFELSEEFLAAREQFREQLDRLQSQKNEDSSDLLKRAREGKFDPTNELQILENVFRATYNRFKEQFQPIRDREQSRHAKEVARLEAAQYSLARTLEGKSQLLPETISLAYTAEQQAFAEQDPKIEKVVRVPDALIKLTETI